MFVVSIHPLIDILAGAGVKGGLHMSQGRPLIKEGCPSAKRNSNQYFEVGKVKAPWLV